jgi:O-antigen/teichoic acid export membrane protein
MGLIKETITKIKNLKNLTVIGVTDITIKSISSLFWFYMASILSAENYGEINYLITIAGIGSTITSFGAATSLTVYVAKKIKIEPPLYIISLSAGGIGALIVFLMFDTFVISVFLIGHILFVLGMSELLGRKLYVQYSKFVITQNLLMVSLSLGLYYLLGFEGVVLGIGLSYFPYILRIVKGFQRSKIDFSVLKSRKMVLTNNYILNLVGVFSTSVDRLITAPMLGFALLGNYAVGLQVLTVIAIIPANVFRYILPQDASGAPTEKLKKATIIITVILVIIAIFVSPIIMPIVFPKYTESTEIIQIMALSVIPSTIGAMYTSKLLGNEKSLTVLIGSLIYLISSTIGILVLGNMWSINGVAVTLVISATVQMTFLIIMSKIDKIT